MTDTTNGGQQAQESPAQLNVLAQYVKDLSFENPNAPRSLAPNQTQPSIGIQINVGVAPLSETDYEVSLKLEGKAENSGTVLFAVDLTYSGIFRLQNVPQQALHPLLMIECPRFLFPFARRLIADLSAEGGFPPFMLEPIDFAGIYAARRAQAEGQVTGNA